jgi:serine/threonine-protein kinase
LATPSQIDRYVVERELGHGAFGTVYRARHAVTGRPVALKVLHPRHATDAEMVERFFREARAAASTMSPYIVDVLDASIAEGGAPFLALELLEGEDLEQHLAGRDRLAILDAIEIARDIAAGVADAHKGGIVHRDLKPANVFLARMPDGTRRAKVLDFGMSKLADPLLGGSARTATGAIMGTPLYMAPEQLKGGARTVEAAADVYALGAILFRLLTGRPTHDARTIEELLVRKLTHPVQSVAELAPGVPSTLVHLVARCLEVDPARRTITAAEVAKELGEMARAQRGSSLPPLSSALASLPPTTLAPSAPSAPSRWPRALAVIALSLLAMTCLASVLAVVSMGGLAWVVGDAASSILEDVETVREASAVAAPTASPASPVAPPAADPRIGTAPPPAAGAPSTVPVGSAADAEGVSVSARVMGMSDGATERAIAEAARAAMGACRSERDESFDLELMWMGWGAMGLGTSNLTPHGRAPATPAEVCAQAAILDASHGQSSSGIVRFHVVLPAR